MARLIPFQLRVSLIELSFRTQTAIAIKLHLREAFSQSNSVRNDNCIRGTLNGSDMAPMCLAVSKRFLLNLQANFRGIESF